MAKLKSVMDELHAKGNEKAHALYGRHGHPLERTLGVSVADLKAIAKKIKGDQALAMELYASGMMEAMYLAGMVAKGDLMSKTELQAWAKGASGMPMIESYTVPWVTVEHQAGRAMAMKWISSRDEGVAAAGWATYSGLIAVTEDDELDLEEIVGLLAKVVQEVHDAQNRVRSTMNSFVMAVARYVEPLSPTAKSTAKKIGNVSVDVGKTACKVPVALEYIVKAEGTGNVGRKKKTIRC